MLSAGECTGATMAAVAARSRDSAEAFAKAHGIEHAYSGIESCQRLDIVYVSNKLHKTLLRPLKLAKVLCEKILAHSVADAEEMYARQTWLKMVSGRGFFLRLSKLGS